MRGSDGCVEHGVQVEGVPFARDGARFTHDFEDLVAWLMSKTDRTATCQLVRIDWETIGRIIGRVGDELLPADRLGERFEIPIDEVAWRKGHRYLRLIGDHHDNCVVWGTEGNGRAAADEFFQALPCLFARASRLTAVSMDTTGGYAESVREHARTPRS